MAEPLPNPVTDPKGYRAALNARILASNSGTNTTPATTTPATTTPATTTPTTFAADTAARKQAANPLSINTEDKVTAANNVAAEQLASTAGEKITFQEKVKLDSMFKTGTADLGLLGYNTDLLKKPASESAQSDEGKEAADVRKVTAGYGGRPNPLDDYANFTYGVSLHILPPGIYNKLVTVPGYQYIPVTDGGQGTVLIASAGRQGENFKRDANFVEDFYFDNLKFTTIIGLNARTRGTNVVEVHFTILEPYGITLMNRLLAVADTLKAKNWDQLPFMLQIDFYGNSDEGQPLGPITEQTKFIPIKLINCKIKASLRGSEYQFDAVPYAHTAYSESNCTTPAFFEVQAKNIQEFFSSTRDAGQAAIIVDSRNAANDAVKEATKNDNEIKSAGEFGFLLKDAGNRTADTLNKATDAQKSNNNTAFKTYSYTAAMNSYEKQLVKNNHQQFADEFNFVIDKDISDSVIVDPKRNPASSTNMKNRTGADAIRSKFNVVPTGIVEPDSSTFSINAGTSIVEVINQVIKNSDFFKKQIKDPPSTEVTENDPIFSFKIVPRLELGEFDEKRRVYKKTITYYITKIPYYNQKYPNATKSLPSKCVKEYYYMYTGLNQSILDFSIDFDSMFFTVLTADAAKNQSITVQEAGTVESKSETTSSDNAKKGSIAVNKYKNVSAQADSANTTNATRDKTTIAANDLHKSMMSSSRGDMINVKLKISGDPEFIKQDDLFFNPSNMVASGQDLAIDKHSSLTMDTQEIFALLEFRTPSDINQDTGLMVGLEEGDTYSTSVFSGIYRIITIENSFDKGQFTQSLDLIRLLDQIKYDSNTPKTASQERAADPKTAADAATATAKLGEAQHMQNATDANPAATIPTTNKEVGKVEEVENKKANVTDVAPDLNRQSLQKINETAPTTSINSTAGDGNVVDMGLG